MRREKREKFRRLISDFVFERNSASAKSAVLSGEDRLTVPPTLREISSSSHRIHSETDTPTFCVRAAITRRNLNFLQNAPNRLKCRNAVRCLLRDVCVNDSEASLLLA